jgi:hypothetical protein
MSTEDRLRAAVTAATDTVEPSEGWDNIQARIERREHQWRRPAVVFPAVAAVLAAVVLAAALLTADRGDKTDVITEPPVTTTPTPEPDPEVATPSLWPPTGTSQSFEDPKALALSFAKDFLGMPNPVIGDFREPGEVDIRPKPQATGLITTLEVVKSSVGAWSVTEARAANLQMDTPARDASLTSPVQLSGRSRAFEATVNVTILDAGQVLARGPHLAQTFFTGGGAGAELEPFQTTVEFPTPTQSSGMVVLSTASAEDGSLSEATVRRVRFLTIGGPVPESFVATTTDGRVVRFRTQNATETASVAAYGATGVSVSPDGSLCAVELEHESERNIAMVRFSTGEKEIGLTGSHPAFRDDSGVLAWVRFDGIVVYPLPPDGERVFDPLQGGASGDVRSLSWHPDRQTIAFERDGSVYLLDISSAQSLDDARRVATGSNPLFVGSNLAFVTSKGAMTVDSAGRTRLLFDPGITVTNIDVDASGRHFLLVDDKHNLFWSGGGVIEPLATGIVDAEW